MNEDGEAYVIGGFKPGELREDLFQRFAANVGQNVESATMRHSHDDRFDAQFTRLVDDGLHGRDEHLTALQAEPFL